MSIVSSVVESVNQNGGLETLRRLKRFLDEAFRVPGTSYRVGWDPIIGMIPWAGDVLTAVMSCAILVHAHRLGVPRVVQFRMVLNIAIDLVLGVIPFVGDAVDLVWKSNSRNFALLERYAAEVKPPTTGDWLFVTLVVAAVVLLALIPLVVLYWALDVLSANLPAVAR